MVKEKAVAEKKTIFSSEEQIRSQILALEQQLFQLKSEKNFSEGYQSRVVRNVDTITGEDSLDSLNPYIQHFIVDGDTEEIISAQCHFKILPFRAYSKTIQSNQQQTSSESTTPSGGGSTSGASSTSTTSSGGGSTSGPSSTSTTPSGGGTTTPSGGGHTSSSYNYGTKTSQGAGGEGNWVWYPTALAEHDVGYLITKAQGGYIIGYEHTHDVTIGPHSHAVYNHHHSCPNHQHNIAHTHTTPNHQHNIEHIHTIPNHTHPAHSHTISPHSHDIDYGIYEKTPTSSTVDIYLSNNDADFDIYLGTYSADSYVEFGNRIKGTGWKAIKFECNELMRIQSLIRIKSDIAVT